MDNNTHHRVFIELWPPFAGALILVIASIVLMSNGWFWGIFGGLLVWGDHLNFALGLGPALGIDHRPANPLYHHISLTNLSLVLGALCAALFARQFSLRRSPPIEYLRAVLGGTVMAAGAVLAGGCTTGGFFTPLLFSSPAAWAMAGGLVLGAWIGLKILDWTMRNIHWGSTPKPLRPRAHPGFTSRQPLIAWLLLLAILVWALYWQLSANPYLSNRSLLIVIGLILGFALQRSRFCFSQVFHGPAIGLGNEMARALIKAVAIGIPLAAIVLLQGRIEAYQAIPATFWLGSLVGGILFGIGMISAGGCASGTLWRAREGQLKMWVTLLSFSWTGSLIHGGLKQQGLLAADFDIAFLDGAAKISALGFQAFMPDLLGGWSATFAVSFLGLAFAWLLLRKRT